MRRPGGCREDTRLSAVGPCEGTGVYGIGFIGRAGGSGGILEQIRTPAGRSHTSIVVTCAGVVATAVCGALEVVLAIEQAS